MTFAIVVVKERVIDNRTEADELIQCFRSQVFGRIPVVLMAQNVRGIPRYYGRDDIVRFLAHVDPRRIPWKKYHMN